ncbi:MAG: gamma-glutamylcyclotransferase family protein [Myxococcota bacterium]
MQDLYFAYGSNMSSARLAARLGEVRPLGRAALDHFELAWNKPGLDGSGKANVRRRVGAATWGVVYAVAPADWPLLDSFESGYARETHPVRDDAGRERSVQLYRWRRDTPDHTPSAEYLELVLAGAREHQLPAAVIQELATSHVF